MSPAVARFLASSVLVASGCSRAPRLGGDTGIADEALRRAAAVKTARLPDVSREETTRLPATHAEARRARITRLSDERLLAPRQALVREHFGDTPPRSFEIQAAPLAGGREAILIQDPGADPRPLIVVFDPAGAVVWTKERPLAGIDRGARPMVVTAGPHGGVALSWFDAPTHLVATRMWDGEGGIFADFMLMEMETCEALSALTWPGRGWLVVASQPAGDVRAQLLAEEGRLAWPRNGVRVGATVRGAPHVSLALDTDEAVTIFLGPDRKAHPVLVTSAGDVQLQAP